MLARLTHRLGLARLAPATACPRRCVAAEPASGPAKPASGPAEPAAGPAEPAAGPAEPAPADRVRRAFFYVPGSHERMIAKAATLDVDCIVLDLEDAVAANKKAEARALTAGALARASFGRAEVLVRINDVRSPHAMSDLLAVAHVPSVHGIVVPKVDSPADLHFVRQFAASVRAGAPAGTRALHLVAMIESAAAIVHLREIAAVPDLSTLVFGAEDYMADIGGVRSPQASELLYARSAVVTHAKAFGLQAIDMVCVNYKDLAVLRAECEAGFGLGFTGKQTIHPAQLPIVQATFLPSPIQVAHAEKILAAYARALEQGIGAFTVDDKMIDMPVIKWAQRIAARAALGVRASPDA